MPYETVLDIPSNIWEISLPIYLIPVIGARRQLLPRLAMFDRRTSRESMAKVSSWDAICHGPLSLSKKLDRNGEARWPELHENSETFAIDGDGALCPRLFFRSAPPRI